MQQRPEDVKIKTAMKKVRQYLEGEASETGRAK
jgi:predicted aldo/keto reductase-like oxidoreductase